MCNCQCPDYQQLVKRMQQHEELITQLVEMIAATNKKVFELTNNQHKKIYSLI